MSQRPCLHGRDTIMNPGAAALTWPLVEMESEYGVGGG